MFLIWLFYYLSLSYSPCHFHGIKILLMWKDFPSYPKHMEWKLDNISQYIAELKANWVKYWETRKREDIHNQAVTGGEV